MDPMKKCHLPSEATQSALEPHIKHDQKKFLETEFHLMLQIAAVEYLVLVDDGLVLMGYSTALVPVRPIDDKTILWHLEVADHDSQLKTSELRASRLEDLRSKKALVGWGREAIMLLGKTS
ncbi:hypothetical protein BJX76DRAFT_354929 [Aspergillus varians]